MPMGPKARSNPPARDPVRGGWPRRAGGPSNSVVLASRHYQAAKTVIPSSTVASKTARRWGRAAASVAVLAYAGLAAAVCGLAGATSIPNPCTAVPGTIVAAALGLAKPPATSLAVVSGTQTCSYGGVMLTVSVGLSVLKNPATPLKVQKVKGLEHGLYSTYLGSTQTQVAFYKGSAATGTYGVIRNFGKIPRASLERFAKALYAAIGVGGSNGAPGTKIVSST
jgi:hypothetical protein